MKRILNQSVAALAMLLGLLLPAPLAAQTLQLKDTLGGAPFWPIDDLVYSPDGKTLASVSRWYQPAKAIGSTTITVKLWNVATGKNIATFETREAFHPKVALNFPSGSTVLQANSSGHLFRWDLISGKKAGELWLAGQSEFGGRYFPELAASADSKILATGDDKGNIDIWNATTGQSKAVWSERHKGEVTALLFGSDGKTLASAGEDKMVRLWDTTSGKLLADLKGHTAKVTLLALSQDGKRLASWGEDKSIRIWKVAGSKSVATLPGLENINALAFSPDAKILVVGSSVYLKEKKEFKGEVRLLDAETGKEKSKLATGWFRSLAFRPDGQQLAVGVGTEIALWDVNSGKLTGKFPSEGSSNFSTVAFRPDGKTLISYPYRLYDEPIKFWDMNTGKLTTTLKAFPTTPPKFIDVHNTPLVLSADGKMLFQLDWNDILSVWDLPSGKQKAKCSKILKGHGDEDFFGISPDGATLARIELENNKVEDKITLWDTITEKKKFTLDHPNVWRGIVFNADGKWLATNGYVLHAEKKPWTITGTVIVWDVATGKEKARFSQDFRMSPVAFSHDSKLLAIAGEKSTEEFKEGKLQTITKNWLKIWEIGSKEIKLSLKTEGMGSIYALAFSPDGKLLATGGEGGKLRLWDLATGKNTATVEAHPDHHFSFFLTFSPDGKLLASNGQTTIKLWEVVPAK